MTHVKKLFFIFFCLNVLLVFGNKKQEYKMHTVKKGETLYQIAKLYKVSIDAIENVNPSIVQHIIKPEQILRIPISIQKKEAIQPKSNPISIKSVQKTIQHTVKKGETLYSISKLYGMKPEDIRTWNSIDGNAISIDEKLTIKLNAEANKLNEEKLIKEKPITETPAIPIVHKDTMLDEVLKNAQTSEIEEKPALDNESQTELAKKYKSNLINKNAISVRGTGAPMTTTLGAMESVYFVVHKTLPIGTVIKIINLVNNKSMYAKVIGKLEDSPENEHVIVRYTLGIKKALQLKDGKCYVQIIYPE